MPAKPLSDDARYREFRSFLSGVEGRPLWVALSRGFAFGRDFERNVRDKVHQRLAKHAFASEPVIVHGQTGTGKTIALASAAFAIAQEGHYPVLYIERRTQKPIFADIDRFCQWAEDNGAQASLVVWDGMLQPEEYAEFLRVLSGRGTRKIVLLGTCYHLNPSYARSIGAVEAPALLSRDEQLRFAQFLKTFHPSLTDFLAESLAYEDQTFLVALYRLLLANQGCNPVGGNNGGRLRRRAACKESCRNRTASEEHDRSRTATSGSGLHFQRPLSDRRSQNCRESPLLMCTTLRESSWFQANLDCEYLWSSYFGHSGRKIRSGSSNC